MRRGFALLLAAALVLAASPKAAAMGGAALQQGVGGLVAGRVTDASTGNPLEAVQISIPGTQLGTLTDRQGRYRIANVPVGEVTLRAQRIGMTQVDRKVTATADRTAAADFLLTEKVLDLDAIVVTGTAGGMQRRAIGNVVSTMNADKVLARSPVGNVDQLLGQRTPGLMMMPSTGSVGSGASVRIRGIASLTQGNDPIVYIDGVRMDSDPRRGPSQRGGANQSRLNDINPADIESIEVIKGPAAATLYGTEASNGVIQIITKRGTSGRPQFDVMVRTGSNWLWNPGERTGLKWMRHPTTNEIVSVNVYDFQKQNGFPDPYDYGSLRTYNMSVQGGTDAVRYFGSVSRDDDVGIVDWNWNKRTAVRLNVDALLSEKLTMKAGGSYIRGRNRLAEGGGLQTNTFHNLNQGDARNTLDNRRGYRYFPMEELAEIEDRADTDRTTGSLELRFRPFSWLTNRLVGGLDMNAYNDWTLTPMQPEGTAHFFGNAALGSKSSTRGTRTFATLDYSASANFDRQNYSFQPSIGFQYYKTENSSISASAQQFPAVPITSISGGAVKSSGDSLTANATVGVYVQQQVGWKNRAFVTAAVRADDNSAFGADFDIAIYPKLSGTWVISEEAFWSLDFIRQLRLRAAWGAAGKQPATFAANRLYSPVVGYGNNPALVPGAYGNSELKPERGEELEFGFDASFLNGRIDLEFTRYQKVLRDAIVSRTLAPSTGFSGAQIVNLGRVDASGNEVGVIARVIERRRFSWEVDAQFATMQNEIKDLGGVASTEHRVGYSIADHFMKTVLSGEINAAGIVLSAMCDGGTGADGLSAGGAPVPCANAPLVFWGHSQPTWQIGFGNAITLFSNLRLYARVEGNGGHKQNDTGVGANHGGGRSEPEVRRDDALYLAWRAFSSGRLGLYDASFLRLREISASYDLPERFSQTFGARRGTISVGMRNVMMLWTKHHGWSTYRDGHLHFDLGGLNVWDPEIRATGDTSTGYQTVLPPAASATVTLRFRF